MKDDLTLLWKEAIRRDEINLYIYHKCPVCGRFMRRTKTLSEKLDFGNYKCTLLSYHWEYGWEHD
jgi:hypothetical protein